MSSQEYFSNYPATLLPDLKHRLKIDYVVHVVIQKIGDEDEINSRLWGGTTKSGKDTTRLWTPLIRLGAYGLNWKTKSIEYIGLDIDAKNNGPIQSEADKDELVKYLARLRYCQVRNSSSGKAIHVYVDLDVPIPNVNTEREYASYRNAMATRIENDLKDIGYTKFPIFDRVGTILYMWKADSKLDAYKLLWEASEKFNGILIPETKAQPVGGPGWPMTPEDAIVRGWSKQQYDFFTYLAENDSSFSPLPSEGIICHAHTNHITQAVQHLGLPGYWSTNTPASDLSHHNCYITVLSGSNIIRVWRAGNGSANETAAWMDVNNRTVAILNGVARSKLCLLSGLHAAAKTDRARGPIGRDVLKQLNIPFHESWGEIEANIQVNTSKVKFIVKRGKGTITDIPGWIVGATQLTFTLDIDDGLHTRKVEEFSGRTENDEIKLQYTRDDSGEMIVYFQNERGDWQSSSNEALLKSYLQERYKLSSRDMKRIMALKYANDVMMRVEMPCVPFGKFEYEKRTYWNVPPTEYNFNRPDGERILSRISSVHPSLQDLANQCPAWFALYNHIFAQLQVPKEVCDHYSIETGADYGLLWAAYKVADPLNIVPILILHGTPESGKTFFAESFRHFYTGRGAYKVTNSLASNYTDWLGVVVGSSDDLDEFDPNTITRLKNIGSGDRLEVNPKFKRPSLIGGYFSLIMNMKDLGTFPTDYLKDRCTFVGVPPINNDIPYDANFFSAGCRTVTDPRIHARIPNVHWTLNAQAEAFFQYLCLIQLPIPVRRYALPIAGVTK